jgi:hypothetical protein
MLDRQCAVCATPFITYPSLNKRYCSKECAGIGRRKPDDQLAANYRLVTIPTGHPLATKKSKTIPEHRLIMWNAIGPGPHVCHKCGNRITWMPDARTAKGALVVDHLDRNSHNNDPSNLAPSCHSCNVLNRAYTVLDNEPHRLTYKGTRLRGGPLRPCEHCGNDFAPWPQGKKADPTRGRFCSRACGYTWRRHRS